VAGDILWETQLQIQACTIQRVESGGRVIMERMSPQCCVNFLLNGMLRGRGHIKYMDFSTLNIHTAVTEYLMLPPSLSDE
jgi:hypothetical protein